MNGFWITIILAVIGIVCYAVFAGRAGMQQEFRDGLEGYADLLRYARPIKPGIMLGKGGELIAGFFYRGTDTESASVGEMHSIAARINDVLRQRGSGWMVHIDANRASAIGYPENSSFLEPVARMMDDERKAQYNEEGAHFESAYAIFFTYLPPLEIETRATSLMFESSDKEPKGAQASLQAQIIERFQATLDEIQSQFSTVFESLARMGEQVVTNSFDGTEVTVDHLSGYLHYAATGINQHIVKPPLGMMYDAVIGSQDFTGGNTPRVGKKHIRCLTIEGFPAKSVPGILAALNSLPVTYRWSTRFIFLDTEEGRGVLDRFRKKWRQKVRGMRDQATNSQKGPVDADALAMEVDANTAMGLASSGVVRFGHYTSIVVLMSEDEGQLKQVIEDCSTLMRNLGFPVRNEEVNAVEAFLGTLPGHGFENVRRPILHTLNLAHLLPTTATWPGLAKNPSPFFPPNSPPLALARTSGSAPFRINLHVDDVGHGVVFGPTGAGKSTLLEFIEASFLRYPGAKVRKFDKGYSSFVLCNAVGGSYYDIGGDNGGTIGFCPLKLVHKPSERAWAEDYIETLLKLQDFAVLPMHRGLIRNALNVLAKAGEDERTMTDFVKQLQDTQLREALVGYTLEGNNEMLDAVTDNVSLGRFVVFEMEHLMGMGEKYAVPVLLYLFRCVERGLDGSPTLLVMDEAWLMLSHPLFREKIREWLKTLRKANCAVWFATQELSDVGNSPIRDVIFSACPTRILLANPELLSDEESAKPYRSLGLNDRQIELIGHMAKKQDYYYTSPLGRRRFQLGLGPLNLAFVGASGKEDVKKARELIANYGDHWVVEWLMWCNATKDWGRGRLAGEARKLDQKLPKMQRAA
jgi:type IV secretion/conjugal transfer VirB4 family ATPase